MPTEETPDDTTGVSVSTDRQSPHPLERLETTARIRKRAQYEALAFEAHPDGVQVRNESHARPAAHTYVVTVTDGLPTACTCPGDSRFDAACKHRVAVAIRPPVLRAAATDPASGLRSDIDPTTGPKVGNDDTGDTDTTAGESATIDDRMFALGRTDDWAIAPDGTVRQRDDAIPLRTTASLDTDVSTDTSEPVEADEALSRPADCDCDRDCDCADRPDDFHC